MEIFRAYDIRGEYPKDINDDICYKIARILVRTFNAKNVVIGRDVSLATPKIYKSLIKGALDQGADIIDIGIAGTDVVYFAAGHYKFNIGLEVTASHSAGYLSGIKILGPGATPFGKGMGMEKLKEDFLNYREVKPEKKGKLIKKDVWKDFITQVLEFVDASKIKPLKVVSDASNAVGVLEIDNLEKHLPQIEFIKLNWKLDGRYPGHQPNPFLKENRQQLVAKVKKVKADLGIAFDGDADRVYFVDENGDYIFGVYINALIAEKTCRANPGGVVLYDVRATRYIKMKILEAGGIPKMELVGHVFFKNRMRKENAIFGGEASGHIYYNFGDYMVENSLIAFCQILQIISESGKSLSELTREARINYPVSGEYNFILPGFAETDDLTPEAIAVMNKILAKVREKYSDGEISDFDTLTIYYPDWNFNLRPSANDPVLRFTAEATSNELLLRKQKEVFELLKAEGCQYLNDSGVELLY
ncbi:phosphomannomutase/phosphoglucomutase [bacterium]|uniref:Phosphomannomutase n=3 Tax=Candidatus Nealsoniibacteriota TaxID=1817911 RepID=A0A2M7EBM2_9BACT|nr:phosphomannomutase/phosphoglucomutase [bacterium]PIV65160.1 MAG: phosphomannomutase [Candidatus Nealsonbacteria bacterium CG01_land_8_20_14_3_00_12]PIW34996.1 MAG: phosphomannomutase [Candidatus Nealsonbacteria bacterium CG15_BIG_FIL_POST_REV_8_21_14_020_37_12]PJA82905.1 MAG: phosphomannomutase [Candidatus Nealsonbacteria bacterium CG_4_9_14_3_um_filter_37_29]